MSEAAIVVAGAERLDELEPLWEALRQHHHAVMPSLGPLREHGESWRRRREHYERVLAEPVSLLLVAEREAAPAGAEGPDDPAPATAAGLDNPSDPAPAPAPGEGLDEAAATGGPLAPARDVKRVVGYALVSTSSPSQTWAIESAATLETIVLLPEERGRGLGSALVERVKAEVRAAGVTHLGLGVVAGNEDAIRFYRRHGFEPAFVEMIARP